MALPIPLELPPRDPRAELQTKLAAAPVDHAEALLSAYELLQALHDKGMIETARGAVGSSDEILKIIVDASKTPEAIRGMRNLIILAKLAAAIDLPASLEKIKDEEPLSLLQLMKKMNSKDARRALTVMTGALETAGKALGSLSHPD